MVYSQGFTNVIYKKNKNFITGINRGTGGGLQEKGSESAG